MAIINRDVDFSQQLKDFAVVINTAVGASAGALFPVFQAPFPCTLKGVAVAANSISGAPQVSLSIKRYTATGVTTIPYVGSTLAVLAYGASAPYQVIPLATAGSTLLNMQAGDVLCVNQEFSGGNVALGSAVVSTVVQGLQDILKYFAISQ